MKEFHRLFGRDNPYDQAQKSVNKLFEGQQSGVQYVTVVLFGLVAVLMTYFGIRWPETPPPEYLPFLLFAVFSLMLPGIGHRMISGERESESLELLLVAPVSAMQVLTAKFRRGFMAMIVTLAITLVPVLGWAIAIAVRPEAAPAWALLFYTFGSIHLVFYGSAVLALSLLVSAYAKTNAASLISDLAIMLVVLLVAPIILQSAVVISDTDIWLAWHPVYQLTSLNDAVTARAFGSVNWLALMGWTLIPSAINGVLAWVMVRFAARRLEEERLQGQSISETIHAGS